MIAIFWLLNIFLFSLSLFFVLPWLKVLKNKIFICLVMLWVAFGLYLHWGSSEHLADYYSEQGRTLRIKHQELRKLLAEFRKEEFRLRIRLEKNNSDIDAEWRLLDLLAIKALYNQDYKLAVQYWQSAIKKIPKQEDLSLDKERIENMIDLMKGFIKNARVIEPFSGLYNTPLETVKIAKHQKVMARIRLLS